MLYFCWAISIVLAAIAVGFLVAAAREMFGSYGDWTGVFLYLVGAVLFGIFSIFPVGLYQASISPSFELKKNEWTCTASHRQTTTTMVMSGKVMVPLTTTTDVCDRYDRRG